MRIAVVAAACEFPDARTPQELWSSVLHGRRSFRRIPAERLIVDDYLKPGLGPDSIYPIEAALLEGYRFDRESFRVPQTAFERTDLSHWLALDVATRALSELDAAGLAAERDTTAVIVANTLTGEFSRAHLMRYRWPYVERLMRELRREDGSPALSETELRALESAYKAPFPAPDEDSLAGGLSNTIAGRIANHHGLRGGAHTVDGACASSLVAVVTAFERLAMGDIGCALVGAVDLSLDPFELVGFARNGALARRLMRVFDEGSEGFWPGEGCGFMLLASEQVVARRGWPVLAWVRGAAMSTDGEGALTRPTVEGQTLAARRAWDRAGMDAAQADYFEAHGTGTATGDPVELAGLSGLFGATLPAHPIPVGSIKANIGHTKAAAGMAGMLKAIAICRERVIPATTGCEKPHPVLHGEIGLRVTVRERAEPVTHSAPLAVGVSSFGFGGVNCHVVVQGADEHKPVAPARPTVPSQEATRLPGELLLLQAGDEAALAALLEKISLRSRTLSRAELGDLAHSLQAADDAAGWRACLVATTPQDLQTAAEAAVASLRGGSPTHRQVGAQFCWAAPGAQAPRVALLFPGQGLPLQLHPGPWAARFPGLAQSAARASSLAALDLADTAVVQPLFGEIALAGLHLLQQFGVTPTVVFGHSFGELPALLAAGRIEVEGFRALAAARGRLMSAHAPRGAMAAVRAPRESALALAAAHGVDLACENGADRYVLAGAGARIDALVAACHAAKIPADLLPTSRAFHSQLMTAARDAFSAPLAGVGWQPPHTAMVSSITGRRLDGTEDLAGLLAHQVVAPVRFLSALQAIGDVDLVIEVGASASLVGLVAEGSDRPALSLELFGPTPLPALLALGAVWTFGGRLARAPLYDGRLLRPFDIDRAPLFLANPCGQAPHPQVGSAPHGIPAGTAAERADAAESAAGSSIDVLRAVLAEVIGLAPSGLDGSLRLLADLHLNSIRARHAVATTARRLGLAQLPFDLSRLSKATVGEVATYLDGLRRSAPEAEEAAPAGVAPWLRICDHAWVEAEEWPATPAQWPCAATLVDSLVPLPENCRSLIGPPVQDDPALQILVLPGESSQAVAEALLQAARELARSAEGAGLLVLQGARLANGFLRSVAAELAGCRLCAVEYERLDPNALSLALGEYARLDRGYSELRLRGELLQRRRLVALDLRDAAPPWTPAPGAVVLITGGGRGIGAATALALARRWPVRLALVGRSAVNDPEVLATLLSLQNAGGEARYFRGDLADAAQAAAIVADIETELGPVAAIIHSAGVNWPVRVSELSRDELMVTINSKVSSLVHLLEYLPVEHLELVVGYGSIIGELGLAGEAHYALANEWLNNLLENFALAVPACRVIPICWSAWGETGMAVRMEGVLDGLRRTDTRAIGSAEAVDALFQLLGKNIRTPVVVTGRHGRTVDPDAELRELQQHRYLERPRVFYPGVELVADAELCSDGDRYLRDHAPFGVPVLPLVCALEAMVSAAQCLCRQTGLPLVEDLRIGEAVSCSLGQRFVLRTAALVGEDGAVAVEIRSGTTGFEVVHFAARLRWNAAGPVDATDGAHTGGGVEVPAAGLLYRGLCFHGPRFERVAWVGAVSATHCQFSTGKTPRNGWYGPFLPQAHAAGHPSIRDAFLHALQMCIPQHLVLPVGAAAIRLGRLHADDEYTIHARQTFSDGRRYVFDIQARDAAGELIETWTGLELLRSPVTSAAEAAQPLAPELLQSFVERIATDDLAACDASAGVAFGEAGDRRSSAALSQALGRPVAPVRRADGAIWVDGAFVSTSHAEGLTVALARTAGRIAVDLQFAPGYSLDDWRLTLGPARSAFADQLAQQGMASVEAGMLLAWTLSECLIKLGRTDWPPNIASVCSVDTARTGPVWHFALGTLRLAVASFALTSPMSPRQAMLAMVVEVVADPAAAGLMARDNEPLTEQPMETAL